VILDGHGNVSGSGTFDVNGTITTSSISGTYTEKSNCTGTATITAGTSTLNFNLVVAAAGKEIFMIETDSGTAGLAGPRSMLLSRRDTVDSQQGGRA
jgi:hypothetical protein